MLMGFVGVAGFSFLAMNHDGMGGHNGCIAATANDTVCPMVLGAFESAFFHIDTFKSFSLAVVGSGMATLFVLLFAAAIGRSLLVYRAVFADRHSFFNRHAFDVPKLFEKSFTSWLALHENSPTTA